MARTREQGLTGILPPPPAPAAAPPTPAPAPASPAAPARRKRPVPVLPPKPIRTTVDLVPDENEALRTWAAGAQPPAGDRQVHGQQVIRALVRRLLADPGLAAEIEQDLIDGKGALNLRT